MKRFGWLLLGPLVVFGRPAAADVVLEGNQHLGDDPNGVVTYSISDPVTRTDFSTNPTHFEISDITTITAIRFDNAVFELLPAEFDVTIDGTKYTGTLSGGTLSLSSPVTLNAGSHTLAPDAFCINGGVATTDCSGGATEDDVSWTSITLISAQTSTSLNFNQRHHLGDKTETGAGNLYYKGKFYPDAPDGTSLSISFTLDRNRRLTTINFYALRDVNAAANDLVKVDGVQVAVLSGNGTPYTVSPSNVFLLANVPHTLEIDAGSISGNFDDFSWDDIVLTLVNDPLETPGRFNAVDTGQDAVTGVIQTKVAGSTFSLDLTALNSTSSGTLTDYNGTVTVELLNAGVTSGVTDAYGCDASWSSVQFLGTATYSAADNGRVTFPITYNDAVRIARIKQTDVVLGVSGCSGDAFSIRPSYLGAAVASDGGPAAAGTTRTLNATGATGSPTHKAGQPFTIQVTGYTDTGAVAASYDGSPTVTAQTSLLGSNMGTSAASGWTGAGTLRSDTATYSEAGAVRLLIDDATYAQVDAGDTTQAARDVVPTTLDAGRFTPDHFAVAKNTPVFTPGCSNTFTYVGQPFGFATAPVLTLTAVAAGGTTTTNYCDTLYKLPANADQSTYTALNGSLDSSATAVPDNSIVSQCPSQPGVALLTINPGANALKFARTTPTAPFDAEIVVGVGALNETDGVTWSGVAPAFGAATAGNGVQFDPGVTLPSTSKKDVRFGRLVIDNAYGSELEDLAVPLRAEYYSNGFATNSADNCTTLPVADVSLSGATVSTSVSTVSPATLAAGVSSIVLAAPGATGQATVNGGVTAAALSWLRPDMDGDGVYDNDPYGVATFGVYKGNDKRIFLREVVP